MVDTHCHLTDKRLRTELEQEVNGLEILICSGTSIDDSVESVAIAERYDNVFASVGIHPEELNHVYQMEKLKLLAQQKKVVAIGETGLDYFSGIGAEEKKQQKELFRKHIELGEELDLPLVVHNRNANDEVMELLEEYACGVQLHCFVQDKDFAIEAVKRGWYLSFGGVVTFKKSDYLREISRVIPLEQLVTETDAPLLAPEPIRGSLNKPSNVKIVVETIAKARSMEPEELAKATVVNTRRLFRKINE